MDTLSKIQDWYYKQCDGDWEHGNGIKIETLDNPGWFVSINFQETDLEDKKFSPVKIERTENDWIHCKVKDGIFEGAGGPHNLNEILAIFLEWVDK